MLTLIAAWLLADVMTGLVHWWEDHYLVDHSPYRLLAMISKDNSLHHSNPEGMSKFSYWGNLSTSAPYAWGLALVCWSLNSPTFLWVAFFFAGWANLVHRFAHTPRSQVPRWIQLMQWSGLFIRPAHHAVHHRHKGQMIRKEDSSVRFCPMTSWMNPLLDYIKFFSTIEYLLGIVGIRASKERK